jgi:hypothetical protein
LETILLKLSHPRYQLPVEVMVKEDRLHLLPSLPQKNVRLHLLPSLPQKNVHECVGGKERQIIDKGPRTGGESSEES